MHGFTDLPLLTESEAVAGPEPDDSSTSPFGITVLRCREQYRATKTWTLQADGSYLIGGYDAGMWFDVLEVPVWTLAEQFQILSFYSRFPNYFVVRGALTAEMRTRSKREPGFEIRLLVDKTKHPEVTITRDVMRRYFWYDLDGFPLRPTDDLVRNPAGGVHYAVQESLPPCFHEAAYFWQLSAACGSVAGQLRAHIGFDIGETVHDEELKARIKALPGCRADLSVCAPAQKFWIASPIMLNGAVDPLPCRWGWHEGSRAAVTIPVPPKPPRVIASRDDPAAKNPQQWQHSDGGGIEGALAQLGDDEGLGGFHEPLGRACFRYARNCHRGFSARNDIGFIKWLQAAVAVAPTDSSRDRSRYLTAGYLQGEIDSAVRKLDSYADTQCILMALKLPSSNAENAKGHRLDVAGHAAAKRISQFFTAAAGKRVKSSKAKRKP